MENQKTRSRLFIPLVLVSVIVLLSFEDSFAWANIGNDNDCKYLLEAIQNNDTETVKEFIDTGADVNQLCQSHSNLLGDSPAFFCAIRR